MIKKMTLALLVLTGIGANAQDNVGIGTTSPQNKLHVAGDVRIETIDAGADDDKILVADADGVVKDSGITKAELATAVAGSDGSATKVTAGANVTVTGTGTTADPYVIVSTDTNTQLTEAEVDAFVANNGYLTSFTEVDGSVTNELTDLSLSGTTLTLSNPATGGNSVDLSSFVADGSETVVNAGTNVTVTGAGTTTSPYVVNAANEVDGSVTNELTDLSLSGTTLTLSNPATGGNSVDLSSFVADGSETVVNAGANVTVTGSGTTASPYVVNAANEVDGSVTNELTDLSLSGTTLTLSNPATAGNTVDLSSIAIEPWNKVGGTVAATANTDDAYLAGKVVVGGTDILTYTDAGTTTDAILSVHGAIVTSTSVYADYVFEDYLDGASTIKEDYKFKTLSEVDSFIKANKHLPGVTSIKDLQKTANGYAVNISALSVQVLEKTEELYLHTIEQQKTIDTLAKENEALKARLAKIEKALGI